MSLFYELIHELFQEELNDQIIFKEWGIANSSFIGDTGVIFSSYRDCLISNGHDENTDVHYLKIDVEEAEFMVGRSISILTVCCRFIYI